MDTTSQLYTSLIRYLNSLTGRNLGNHTAIAYRTDLLQFLIWLTENDISVTSPEKITGTHILDYFSHLAGLGRSGVTRTRKLAAIREYYKFLASELLIPSSPAENIIRPEMEKKQRMFLRVDEYMRLLNAAAGNSRDYAILQLFLQTGIKVAVLVGLTLQNIDLDAGTMLINGKGNKQRTIYLEKKATQALRAYLSIRPQSKDQNVFLNYQGNGLSVRGIMDIVKKNRKLAGISKKFSCYSLRHTCVTYKAVKGYTSPNLQELLGHRKPETSLIYVHTARDAWQLMQQTSL